MAKTSITLTHSRASDYLGKASMQPRDVAQRFERLLSGCLNGSYPGATGFTIDTGPATGTVTLSGGADGVVVTVAGLSNSTVPKGASDAATATATAAAINANADMAVLVTATASGAVITITSNVNGAAGNLPLDADALAAGAAIPSAANLSGGATASYTF